MWKLPTVVTPSFSPVHENEGEQCTQFASLSDYLFDCLGLALAAYKTEYSAIGRIGNAEVADVERRE